jgi:hypothetical protein
MRQINIADRLSLPPLPVISAYLSFPVLKASIAGLYSCASANAACRSRSAPAASPCFLRSFASLVSASNAGASSVFPGEAM